MYLGQLLPEVISGKRAVVREGFTELNDILDVKGLRVFKQVFFPVVNSVAGSLVASIVPINSTHSMTSRHAGACYFSIDVFEASK